MAPGNEKCWHTGKNTLPSVQISWFHKFGKESNVVRKAVTMSRRHDEFVMAKIKTANLFNDHFD